MDESTTPASESEDRVARERRYDEILWDQVRALRAPQLDAYLNHLYGVIRSPIEQDEERADRLRKAWEAGTGCGR
jgi:hypothetical protein